jgi:hypothetical protein
MTDTTSTTSKLTEEHRATLLRDGYVIVPDVVPAPLRDAVIASVCAARHATLDDPESWYWEGAQQVAGVVYLEQDQACWDIRQYEPLHRVFADIFQEERLWIGLHDSVAFKAPIRDEEQGANVFAAGSSLAPHWDCTITDPEDRAARRDFTFSTHHGENRLQALVMLSDTTSDMGGFICMPDLYRNLEEWIADQGPDWDGSITGEEFPIVAPEGKAGDLLIFSALMAHGNGVNRSDRLRLAQYVNYHKAGLAPDPYRVDWWEKKRPMPGFDGTDHSQESLPGEPVHLTDLGRKVMGVDPWPGLEQPS